MPGPLGNIPTWTVYDPSCDAIRHSWARQSSTRSCATAYMPARRSRAAAKVPDASSSTSFDCGAPSATASSASMSASTAASAMSANEQGRCLASLASAWRPNGAQAQGSCRCSCGPQGLGALGRCGSSTARFDRVRRFGAGNWVATDPRSASPAPQTIKAVRHSAARGGVNEWPAQE